MASTIIRVNALGILEGLSWKSDPARDLEKIHTGYDLIPNKLRLRLLTEEEKRKIVLYPHLFDTTLKSLGERYLVLELKNTTTKALLEVNNPIKKALLAFQLMKPGGVFLEGIYLFNPTTGKAQGKLQTLPIPPAHTMYEFILYEIVDVHKILNSLLSVDLEDNSSLRIACDRFSRSYNDIPLEDKLIDLCIGLEALYFKDVKKKDRRVTRKGMTMRARINSAISHS